ncbi:MAG: AAA family ATPase, partial [Jatrophihabitans sp.]
MRLHRLSMTAIGPFAEPARIDLARFGDSGLFLLEGPTGSGKSTVLDSISFALYGKLAQSSAVLERLKSHHAPAGTEPVVELVFETQSGLYRVRRTPSYERPKKRAAGSTTVHMSVKLWRLSSADDLDGGELLSHNIGDVEDEITRAVGLSHAQFVQTVLLPQGEFANFLRADTSTKRVLLQRLFGTELLARTQQELIDGRRAAEQSRAAALDSVRHACHSFAGAAGLPDDRVAELIELAELADRTRLAQLLAGVQGGLQATERRAAADREAAAAGRLDAEAALRRGQDLLRRQEIRDRLRGEQRGLAEAAEQVDEARAELAAGRRALSVVTAAEALTAAVARSDSVQDAQARARDAVPEQLYGADESRLREVAAQHRTTVGELAGELRRERELTRLRDEHEQLVGERATLGELLSLANTQLAALPARTAELMTAREQAAVAAGRLDSLAAERDRATTRLVAARQAVAAARAAASNQQLAQEVFEAADRQRGRLESLRMSWRANIASELGLALQSGDPCAVCGSLEHPRPARPTVDHVSRDEVSAAETELHTLETNLQQHRQQLAEQQAELADLRARADHLSPELAEATLARAAQAWAAAEASAGRLPSIEAGLAEQERQLAQLRDQVQAAALAETRLAERVGAVLAAIERDELAVHQARFGYRTVTERVAQLNHDIEMIELAAAASAAADAALAAAVQAGQTFHSALSAAEVADQAAWQQALRGTSELAELASRLRGYDE